MRFIKGPMGEVTVTAVIANTVGRRLRTPAGSRYEVVQSWGDCCKWTVIRAEFGCLPVSIHLVFGCRFDAYSEDTVFDCLVFFRILAEMDSPPRCLGMLYTGQITERALPQINGPVSGVSGVTSNGLGVHLLHPMCLQSWWATQCDALCGWEPMICGVQRL